MKALYLSILLLSFVADSYTYICYISTNVGCLYDTDTACIADKDCNATIVDAEESMQRIACFKGICQYLTLKHCNSTTVQPCMFDATPSIIQSIKMLAPAPAPMLDATPSIIQSINNNLVSSPYTNSNSDLSPVQALTPSTSITKLIKMLAPAPAPMLESFSCFFATQSGCFYDTDFQCKSNDDCTHKLPIALGVETSYTCFGHLCQYFTQSTACNGTLANDCFGFFLNIAHVSTIAPAPAPFDNKESVNNNIFNGTKSMQPDCVLIITLLFILLIICL
jgi:hypothetical protein